VPRVGERVNRVIRDIGNIRVIMVRGLVRLFVAVGERTWDRSGERPWDQ
jgi:hypothetical protein